MTWTPHPDFGVSLPPDFPTAVHATAQSRVHAAITQMPRERVLFGGAFKAVAYRYRAMAEASEAFTESFRIHGDGPPSEERYRQDSAFYAFYASGHSCIESLHFSLWVVGAALRPADFPIADRDLRRVRPSLARERFGDVWPGDALTVAVDQFLSSTEYADWEIARNVLVHRVTPPRIISVGGVGEFQVPSGGASLQDPIDLDDQTTEGRRAWLGAQLTDLVGAFDGFTCREFP